MSEKTCNGCGGSGKVFISVKNGVETYKTCYVCGGKGSVKS